MTLKMKTTQKNEDNQKNYENPENEDNPKNKDAYFDLGTTSNTIYITFFARQQVINPE